ncbi:AMED_5909 family protein [Amycolatopsis sp. NPDC059021]|uniref:AMED_5909 family protein n=1 Tax=Amycolatopsis sp. NPDC059021 TaxID=3346704 RepID=UPI00366D9DCB
MVPGAPPDDPETLVHAHVIAAATLPAPGAGFEAWVKHHRKNRSMYLRVSEIDHANRAAALYWARFEQGKAEILLDQLEGDG